MPMSPIELKIRSWQKSPLKFVQENFQVSPDIWQLEFLEALCDPTKKRIALKACVGPGKTACLAWAAWHFLSCFGEPGEHPKGAAVSISRENLDDNLWPELAKWQQLSPYLMESFEWTKTRVFCKQHPKTWFLSARSWAQKASAEEIGKTLSGLHSKYVLMLIDESGEVPLQILKSADQALANANMRYVKMIQAGNPSSHAGILYAATTTLAHMWHVITITGDPDDPKRSPRIDIDNAREQIKTWGRDDPWVMYTILGLFPPSAINSLLSPDEVEAAMGKHLKEDQYNFSQKRLGVDVALEGDDRTVIFPRQGLASFRPVEMRGAKPSEIAARVIEGKIKWESELEFVDNSGGFGSGVVDSMTNSGYAPQPINFSAKPINPRYYNKRTEMWFLLRDWVRRGGALPNIPQLKRELTTPTYTQKNGKTILEPKEFIKKRLKFSPDMADALCLTFALPDQPKAADNPLAEASGSGYVSDYDPLENI